MEHKHTDEMKKGTMELTNVVRVRASDNRKFRILFEKKKPVSALALPSSTELRIEAWTPFRRSEFHPSRKDATTTTTTSSTKTVVEKQFKGIRKVGALANNVKIVNYSEDCLVVQFLASAEGMRTGFKLTISRGNREIDLFIETYMNQSQLGVCTKINLSEFTWKRRTFVESNQPQERSTTQPQLNENELDSLSKAFRLPTSTSTTTTTTTTTTTATTSAPMFWYPDTAEEQLNLNTSLPILYIESYARDSICEEEKLFSFTEEDNATTVNKFDNYEWCCNLDVNGDDEASHFETL